MPRFTVPSNGSLTRRRALGHALCTLAALALVTGALRMLCLGPALIPWLYLAAVAPWLVWIDVREHRLPNRLVLPGFAAWALGAAGTGLTGSANGWSAVAASLIAGGIFALFLGALAWWGGMGGGDLKLGALLGLALGLVSVPAALLALPLAFGAGGGAAVVVMLSSGTGSRRSRSVAFGPWLLLGAAAALIAVVFVFDGRCG